MATKRGSKIFTCLWYARDAEEAAKFYTSIFPDSRVDQVATMHSESPAGPPGSVKIVEFTLFGQRFQAFNAGPHHEFNDAMSIVVECDNQTELDRYWYALLESGGKEQACGWLIDRYGLRWQIVPAVLGEMASDKDPARAKRVTDAMLKMVKLDIAALEKAYQILRLDRAARVRHELVSEKTRRLVQGGSTPRLIIPRFLARVISGPNQGKESKAVGGRITIGSGEGTSLQLDDQTVSRFHVEVEATDAGIVVRDLGSTNGTRLGSATVREIVLSESTEVEIGSSRVLIALEADTDTVPLQARDRFGLLLGSSAAMREVYDSLERAAPTLAPILITGESGTGKELAARSIHETSPRKDEPFEVVDCGGLPPTLIESELFGHEKGAFTGAAQDHEGAFERADGGTIFLDELGELPVELQPKLLRVLGEREVRRLGGKQAMKVDVRVVAATNRDLRREINVGRFRSDLFYRLAVIQVRMPPLRDRLDDLPMLAHRLLETIAVSSGIDTKDVDLPAELWQHDWPGNVRELRNYLEQLAILRKPPRLERDASQEGGGPAPDAILGGLEDLPLATAKAELIARFERRYLDRLLEKTAGNVAEAARRSGVNRATIFRQIRRHGMRTDS